MATQHNEKRYGSSKKQSVSHRGSSGEGESKHRDVSRQSSHSSQGGYDRDYRDFEYDNSGRMGLGSVNRDFDSENDSRQWDSRRDFEEHGSYGSQREFPGERDFNRDYEAGSRSSRGNSTRDFNDANDDNDRRQWGSRRDFEERGSDGAQREFFGSRNFDRDRDYDTGNRSGRGRSDLDYDNGKQDRGSSNREIGGWAGSGHNQGWRPGGSHR